MATFIDRIEYNRAHGISNFVKPKRKPKVEKPKVEKPKQHRINKKLPPSYFDIIRLHPRLLDADFDLVTCCLRNNYNETICALRRQGLVDNKKIEDYKSGVYMFTNKTTNWIYIGSAHNVYARYNAHIESLPYDEFHTDLTKDVDNFAFTILKKDLSRQDAYAAEELLIKQYLDDGYKLYNKAWNRYYDIKNRKYMYN